MKMSVKTNVSLIVHVSELVLPSNTAQFAKLLLPDQAEFFVRGAMEPFKSEKVIERSGTPLFLYPHEDSQELNAEFLAKNSGPYHLIVPDGNWHQARRVRKRESVFQSVKAVKLPGGIFGEYELRKAQHPEWVSTYEAMAHSLGIIEGPQVKDHLMDFFRIWVRTTLYNRTKKSIYLANS
jgi:DTW domain-containing protein YfiP